MTTPYAGRYYRKIPVLVQAEQVTHPRLVKTTNGVVKAHPGDWLVTDVNGLQWPVPDRIFRKAYEECEPRGVRL